MTPEMVEAGWSDVQADCHRVFEENSHPMWVAEAHGVVAVNRAATLHYGYSRDEFLSMTVDDLCAEETPVTALAQSPSYGRRAEEVLPEGLESLDRPSP